MSSRGNGYIFRVDRHNTTVEVDSRDAMFNETFKDVRNRKGHLVRGGVVLPPDLHTTQESEEEPPSQDGVIAPSASARPIPLSNRFEPLSDSLSSGPKQITPQAKDPNGYLGTVLHMQYHSTLAVPDYFFLRQVTKKL
jgi:hypothetical protein